MAEMKVSVEVTQEELQIILSMRAEKIYGMAKNYDIDNLKTHLEELFNVMETAKSIAPVKEEDVSSI